MKTDDRPHYWYDNELNQIGEQYVKNQHPHLENAEIKFLMTKKPMSKNGRALGGKANRATGLVQFFGRADFVIVISDPAWKSMDRKQREALVDHELAHCGAEVDDDGNRDWVMIGHDIEEFTAIVDRHGIWHDGLKNFGSAVARQLELPIDTAKHEKKTSKLFRQLTEEESHGKT